MAFLSVDNPRERIRLVNKLDRLKKAIKRNNIEEDIGDASYADATEKLFSPVIKSQEKQIDVLNRQNENRLNTLISVSNKNQRKLEESIGERLRSMGFGDLQSIEPPKTEPRLTPGVMLSSDVGPIATDLIPNEDVEDWLGLNIHKEGGKFAFKLGHNDVSIKNDVLHVLGEDGNVIYKTKLTNALLRLLLDKDMGKRVTREEREAAQDEYAKLAELTGFMFGEGDLRAEGGLSAGGKQQRRWMYLKKRYAEVKKVGKATGFVRDHGPVFRMAQQPTSEVAGKGLMPSNPTSLLSMLNLRLASYKAGNHALRNEIIDIADELRRQKRINDNQYKSISKFIEDAGATKVR